MIRRLLFLVFLASPMGLDAQQPAAAADDSSVSPNADETEKAVVQGLRWLKVNQNRNGSWGKESESGMTGLALLAFLDHGETPKSGKFGAPVRAAILHLVDLGLKNHNKLIPMGGEKNKHWPYEHAIATLALARACAVCQRQNIPVPDLDSVVQRAGQYIIDNQHKSGGWDYSYSESSARGGDMSITGWHIQALKACSLADLEFRNMRTCIAKALDFCKRHQNTAGGFGYTGTRSLGDFGYDTLTGAGVLSFQLWEKGDSSAARKGAEYITKRTKFEYNTPDCDLYAHYYESRAMRNCGGAKWKQYDALVRRQLLATQSPDGSWPPPGGGKKAHAVAPMYVTNTHYRTCLCLLILEVRPLPD